MTMAALTRPERLASLHALKLLDTPPEECFDRLVRVASRALGVPVALVSLVDADRQFFKAQVGLSEPWATRRQTPLSHSFCQYVVAENAVLRVEDARQDELLKDNLAIPDLGVVAYLGVPLTDSEGCALGSFCAIDSAPRRWTSEQESLMLDLAQSALSEIELRRIGQELRQLNLDKNELLGIASHDLRNPLAAIVSYSNLLLSCEQLGPLTPAQRRMLERSGRAAEFMLRMVNDLLDVAKVEAGHLHLDLAPCNLAEVAREVVELATPLAQAKAIELTLTSPPHVGVMADADKLQQVLQNLVSNALKFSPRSSPVRVTVELDAGQAILSVIDRGVGIPADEQGRLFQPFGKTSVRPTGGESSCGLGLAIARKIVEGHGARLEVHSQVGQGSTFRVIMAAQPPA